MIHFSAEEVEQLSRHGISHEEAAEQIAYLRNPPSPIVLDRHCTVGDGVARTGEDEHARLLERAAEAAAEGRVTKFVPASGAATRMFKDLLTALADQRRPSTSAAARELFDRLDEFPFAEELRTRSGISGAPQTEDEERTLLRTLLEDLGYAEKPKGLIPFHRSTEIRTAFEEHLLEAAGYARSADGRCGVHFTVAPEHRGEFDLKLSSVRRSIEARHDCTLDVTFSEQHPSTDTLALDDRGEVFRTSDGALLFRPGGHGALLHNLNALRGDVVSIKNIDNVLPDETNGEVVLWKRILIGVLVQLQSEVFELLSACSNAAVSEASLDRAIAFAASRFSRRPRSVLQTSEEKRNFIFKALDRPLRICGVVKNEGEPGGAPFWVVHEDGSRSVQIVESSQVDMRNAEQAAIFRSSTHFNPVDIVCGLRSWSGEPFDLRMFVDPRAVFMSRKSHEGRELTALERPGLWNGAMAYWNTVCVDVPGSTFAPVKTVLDLLRPEHQYRGAPVP